MTSSLTTPTRDELTSGLDIRMKGGMKTGNEGRVREQVNRCRICPWGACARFLRGPGFRDPGSTRSGPLRARFPQRGPCRPNIPPPYTPGSPSNGLRTPCSRSSPHRKPSGDEEPIPGTAPASWAQNSRQEKKRQPLQSSRRHVAKLNGRSHGNHQSVMGMS